MTVEAVTDTEVSIRSGGATLMFTTMKATLANKLQERRAESCGAVCAAIHLSLEPGKTWTQKFTSKRPRFEVEKRCDRYRGGLGERHRAGRHFKALKISSVSGYRRKTTMPGVNRRPPLVARK